MCPALHARMQPPQLATSVSVSTQAPPQVVSVPAQTAAQAPPEQTCPLGHAVPHVPQFTGLDVVSTHKPEHGD